MHCTDFCVLVGIKYIEQECWVREFLFMIKLWFEIWDKVTLKFWKPSHRRVENANMAMNHLEQTNGHVDDDLYLLSWQWMKINARWTYTFFQGSTYEMQHELERTWRFKNNNEEHHKLFYPERHNFTLLLFPYRLPDSLPEYFQIDYRFKVTHVEHRHAIDNKVLHWQELSIHVYIYIIHYASYVFFKPFQKCT